MKEKERENGFIYNGYCKVGRVVLCVNGFGEKGKNNGLM